MSLYFFSIIAIIFNLKNILTSLFFVELSFLSIICVFLCLGLIGGLNTFSSLIFALAILLVAAAESATSLSILIFYYISEKNLKFDNLIELSF